MEPEPTERNAAAVLRQIDLLDRRVRRDRPSPVLPLLVLAAVILGAIPLTRNNVSSGAVLGPSVYPPALGLYWLLSLPIAYVVIHLIGRAQAARHGIWASRNSLTGAGIVALAVMVCLIVISPTLSLVVPGDLVSRGMSPLFTVVLALAVWARDEHRLALRFVALTELIAVLVGDLYDPENVTSRVGWTFWADRGPALSLILVALVPLVAAAGFALNRVWTNGR